MNSPRIEIICVGTELLTGKVNTHTVHLGQKLSEVGLRVSRDHTVGDDASLMRETFAEAWRRADVVICAGGLGPTFDDITREAWAKVLKRRLKFQVPLVQDIRQKFKARGLLMPPMNRRQAFVIHGAEVMPNNFGTAPGQFFKRNGKILVLLPGPARELTPMVDAFVLPKLKKAFPLFQLRQKTFLMVGIPESRVDEIIRPWVAKHKKISGCSITHGILASQSIISVKFTVDGRDVGQVERATAQLTEDLRRLLGKISFGEDDDTIESVVGRLLRSRNQTLAVAESCTGGLISKLITDVSGASDYFTEGISAYQNASKANRLGVKGSSLKKFGAVSEQVAREMAVGLRKLANVDHTLSVTGIAGPTGGTPEKPVGLVYIGYAGPRRTSVRVFHFAGERGWIRHRAALMALDLLRKELLGEKN